MNKSKIASALKREMMRSLASRWGWHCHYCGCGLIPTDVPETNEDYYLEGKYHYYPRPGLGRATLDHIKPVSQGGSKRSLNNVVLACWKCNHNRSDMPYEDFKRRMDKKRLKAAKASKLQQGRA